MDNFTEKLSDFHDFWFKQEKHWFSQSDKFDDLVLSKYGHLLNYEKLLSIYKGLKHIICDNKRKEYIGALLVCDQLIRHKYRMDDINSKSIVEKFTILASKISDKIERTIVFHLGTPAEQCFILLPWRHLNNVAKMNESIAILENSRGPNGFKTFDKFYRATIKRLAKLNTEYQMLEPVENSIYREEYKDVLDEQLTYNSIHPYDFPKKTEKIVEILEDFICYVKQEKITVSLSGGVDSMVLLYALQSLRSRFDINIQALHVNYGNREESDLESDFCTYFCRVFNIPIYVRKITEIKREQNRNGINREFYENITKDIRFDCYHQLKGDVFLGHNQDDVVENIFSNIIKQKNFDNICGMKKTYTENDIRICRPLLSITKKEIYEFAHKYKVPYLKDSTPSWSERGQKRDVLIPQIQQFDKRIIPGLLAFANYNTRLYETTIKTIMSDIEFKYKNVVNRIDNEDAEIVRFKIPTTPDFDMWKIILTKICKHFSLPYITLKSCKNSYDIINYRLISDDRKINLSEMLYAKTEDYYSTIVIYHKKKQ